MRIHKNANIYLKNKYVVNSITMQYNLMSYEQNKKKTRRRLSEQQIKGGDQITRVVLRYFTLMGLLCAYATIFCF